MEYNLYELAEQKNLKGLFVKNLLKKMEENPEKKQEIEDAIKIGLKMF